MHAPPPARRRILSLAVLIIVVLGAATLIVTHFSAAIAAYVTRYAGHEDMRITEQESRLANKGSLKSNLSAQRQVEPDQASAPAEAQVAAGRGVPCPCRKRNNP